MRFSFTQLIEKIKNIQTNIYKDESEFFPSQGTLDTVLKKVYYFAIYFQKKPRSPAIKIIKSVIIRFFKFIKVLPNI